MTRPCWLGTAAAAVGLAAVGLLTGCAGQTPDPPATPVPTIAPTTAPTVTRTAAPAAVSAATAVPLPRGAAGAPAGGLPAGATLTSPDPDTAAAAALTVYYGADTTLDTTPADASRRALPWLTGQLAAATRAYQPRAAPGAVWNAWAAHHAHLKVRVTRAYDDGGPAGTPTRVYRQELVTLTPRGRDGWAGTPVTWTDFLTLTRPTAAGGWRIATLEQTG